MVTDAQGQVAEAMHVPNRASKGKTGGRTIPLHPDLQAALVALQTVREDMATPERPILFSMRAGLRAKEMASLTWAMVTDAQGQVAEVLHVPNRASKGKTGGRTIPLHPDLQAALVMLQTARADMATPERPILFSERGGGLSPAAVRLWFHRLYTSLKMDGCSSHSGRRTFITRAARRVSQVGGSLRDVQELAGHTSLAMTQRYIEGDTEAKRKLVALL
jgi:integrase/recombinase XerD